MFSVKHAIILLLATPKASASSPLRPTLPSPKIIVRRLPRRTNWRNTLLLGFHINHLRAHLKAGSTTPALRTHRTHDLFLLPLSQLLELVYGHWLCGAEMVVV